MGAGTMGWPTQLEVVVADSGMAGALGCQNNGRALLAVCGPFQQRGIRAASTEPRQHAVGGSAAGGNLGESRVDRKKK